MQSSSSGAAGSRGRKRGRGHPPGLSGKEIGLYYRNKNREKAKNKNLKTFQLPSHIRERVKNMLTNSKILYDNKDSNIDGNKYHYIHDSQFKKKFLEIINGDIQQNITKAMSMESQLQRNDDIDRMLLDEYNEKQNHDSYKNMLNFRSRLPAYHKRFEILQLVKNNQVVVISGETGKLYEIFVDV